MSRRRGFQQRACLLRRQRRRGGEQNRANGGQPMSLFNHLCPLVILAGADNKLHLVATPQRRDVFPKNSIRFSAARTFQINNAANPQVRPFNRMRPAGFQQDHKTQIAQTSHQRMNRRLQQRLPAGDFNQRQSPSLLSGIRVAFGQATHFFHHGFQRHRSSAGKGISRIAIRTPQVAPRQTNKNARPSRPSAFALNARINLFD